MMLRTLALSAAFLRASGQPVPGFRPPSVPLLVQSPEVNVWSNHDNAYDGVNTRWEGTIADLCAAVRVDAVAFLLMGDAKPAWGSGALTTATQTGVVVWSTQTVYSFTAGAVAINMTFSQALLADDFDLLSRPSTYVTFSVAATDAAAHSVQVYFDTNANLVVRDGSAAVQWSRMPVTGPGIISTSVTALRLGAVNQQPLVDTNDVPSWGFVYLVADTSANTTMVLDYGNTTRSFFFATGKLPAADNTGSGSSLYPPGPILPPTGPQSGIDRSGNDMAGSPFNLPSADPKLCWAACNTTQGCEAWAYGVPNCGGDPAQAQCWLKSSSSSTTNNKCRVSGAQARPSYIGLPIAAAVVFDLGTAVTSTPITSVAILAVDELSSINWFGEICPPYWRRTLPLNDTTVIPMAMLADTFVTYEAVKARCDDFDATSAALLLAAGGPEYATLTQLTYRQVFGAYSLVWVPSKQDSWYFAKEISSCGCLDTSDVIYPAFPQVLYYSPDLAKKMIIPHLEYAMNYTAQPYPLPWAPHHLGFWPIADLAYTNQENMPLEETSYFLLQIASIGQREAGDLTWLAPYWPLMPSWYTFLIDLLPFPQQQLSTDDFDGPLFNATNLAVKGIASVAAYGYILEKVRRASVAAVAPPPPPRRTPAPPPPTPRSTWATRAARRQPTPRRPPSPTP